MLDGFKTWWNTPYSENMTATRWFLFVGFMIIVGMIWSMILKALSD